MSITLNVKPDYYIRAYDTNTAYYKISSTNSTEKNFRFVVKLYGPSANYLSTVKLTPDSSGYGYYNPTSYISSFLTSDIDLNTSTLKTCTNSSGVYRLDFIEEYGDPIVTYTGTTVEDSRFYYNGCQIYEDYDQVYDNFYWIIASGHTNGHILSPTSTFYLDSTEKSLLYFITSGSNSFSSIYTFYDNSGSALTAFTYIISPSANTMYHLGLGPSNLPVGTTPSNWYYYTVNLKDTTNNYLGTGYTYVYRKDKCNIIDWTQVYWLNQDGGWSNFVFNKRKYKDSKITRQTYQKFLGYGYTVGNRGQTQFMTTVDEIITLNTEWINDTQNILIKSLMYSSDVRILENNILIPYIIIDSEYSEKNTYDDGLYSYQIKLTPANKKIIQNG